ncbi:MAG: DUF89 family protein [Planctomycetes bacterium]|nr:DUF89 family protein [Planctomycetota bacterium]
MAYLKQLANPDRYQACDWDLRQDPQGRAYWVGHFCEHLDLLLRLIEEEYPDADAGRRAAFAADYQAAMHAVHASPERYDRIDVLYLDELRHDLLVRHGFADPFRGIKARENGAALALLPGLLEELDCPGAGQRVEELVRGLFAGNTFDLGSMPTVERYHARGVDFRHSRASLPRRPWLIDDLDAWQNRWRGRTPPRHAAFFVDNAGSDICLGCLPLARWMLQAGTRVTLAANTSPALNDITAAELASLLVRVDTLDATLAEARAAGRLTVVETGGCAPLLDLSHLAPACVAAAADADLVILHGMGRAVESNFRTCFACDAVWSAVLKDEAVAQHVGGRLFDCIFRFAPAGNS